MNMSGVSAETSVLLEMGQLIRMRPSLLATATQLANFYAAKARLHRHIAATGGVDVVVELAYAAAAEQHALNLMRGVGLLVQCGDGGVGRGDLGGEIGLTPGGDQ